MKSLTEYRTVLKIGVVTLAVFAMFGTVLSPRAVVHAQANTVCQGLGSVIDGNGCEENAGDPTPDSLLATALNLLSVAAGVASVIMLIIAGLRYITSQGDAQTVAKVRGAIIYVAVGLTIIAMSQIIVKYVIVESTRPPDDGVPGNVR